MKNFESAHAHGEPVVINFYDAGVVTDAKITEVAFKPGKVLYDAEIQVKNGMKTRVHGIDSAFISKPNNPDLVKKTNEETDDYSPIFSINTVEKILDHERLNHGTDPLASINRIYRKLISLKESNTLNSDVKKNNDEIVNRVTGEKIDVKITPTGTISHVVQDLSKPGSKTQIHDTKKIEIERTEDGYKKNPWDLNLFKEEITNEEDIAEIVDNIDLNEAFNNLLKKKREEDVKLFKIAAKISDDEKLNIEYQREFYYTHPYFSLNNTEILKNIFPEFEPKFTVMMTYASSVEFNTVTKIPRDLSYCELVNTKVYHHEIVQTNEIMQYVMTHKPKMLLFVADGVNNTLYYRNYGLDPYFKIIVVK